MAFDTGAQRNNRSNDQQNTEWKAQGFLNMYLPTADGGRAKLGAVALKDANTAGVNQKKLLVGLNVSDAERDRIVEKIRASIIIEFRSANQAEGAGFDIG